MKEMQKCRKSVVWSEQIERNNLTLTLSGSFDFEGFPKK